MSQCARSSARLPLDPFTKNEVSSWEQTTQDLTGLSPKPDCSANSPKRVKLTSPLGSLKRRLDAKNMTVTCNGHCAIGGGGVRWSVSELQRNE